MQKYFLQTRFLLFWELVYLLLGQAHPLTSMLPQFTCLEKMICKILLLIQAGLSMALGAFLAGLLLAETEFSLQVESDIAPYRGLLLGLFFMTVRNMQRVLNWFFYGYLTYTCKLLILFYLISFMQLIISCVNLGQMGHDESLMG